MIMEMLDKASLVELTLEELRRVQVAVMRLELSLYPPLKPTQYVDEKIAEAANKIRRKVVEEISADFNRWHT